MGENGVPLEEVTVNLPAAGRDYVWDSDEFDTDRLALVWQWNHKAPEGWSLTEKPGWLRLRAAKATGIADARGTLTQRTVGPSCISETLLDASGMKPGDEAGLCAFQSHSGRIGVQVAPDGSRQIVLRQKEEILAAVPFTGDQVRLRIRYVFTPSEEGEEADTAFFGYSLDGSEWTEFPDTLRMRYTLDYFTGYRSALYNFATLEEGGTAGFDWFRQRVF